MKLAWHNARLQALLIAALGGGVLVEAWRLGGFGFTPDSPGRFPLITGVLLLLCAGLIARDGDGKPELPAADMRMVVGFALLILAFPVVLAFLPFPAASALFMIVGFLWLRAMGWLRAIVTAAIGTAIITVLFQYVFKVVLP